MKKVLIYCLALTIVLGGCKKKSSTEEEPKETEIPSGPDGKGGSIPANADIYLFGKNGLPSANYVLWTAHTKLDNFLSYNLDAMAIEGLFIQGNKINTDKSVNFFGSHLIANNKYRISFFSKNKYYHLAETLKVPISTNFTEASIAYAFYNNSLYMLAEGVGINGTLNYYYKITDKGDFTVHTVTPNVNYHFIAGSNQGAILANQNIKLLWTDVKIYRDQNLINNFEIQVDGYSYITVLDMQMIDDQQVFFSCSARRDSDGKIKYLFITANLNTKKVNYPPATQEIPLNATIGNVLINQSKVYIPVTAPDTKECHYITLLYNPTGGYTVQKFQLETPGTENFHADQIFISGNDIYVQGGEGALPCYWKNNKLMRLKHNNVNAAYIYDIRK